METTKKLSDRFRLRNFGTRTNVRKTNIRKDKRQKRQTSESDKRQKGTNVRKIPNFETNIRRG